MKDLLVFPPLSPSFIEKLKHRLETDAPRRKGDRTRERLKLGAAQVLEQVGYHAMRIADVTNAAGTSDGSFYIYFADKKEITLNVLQEFLEDMQKGEFNSDGPRSSFQSICEANFGWLRIVRANAGLMRCVLQLADEDPEFGRIAHASNRNWLERIARSVVRKHRHRGAAPATAMFAAYALGAMMDELVRRIAIYPDEVLVSFLGETCQSDEDLAEALSVIWFRTLYPDETLPDGLGPMASALRAFSD